MAADGELQCDRGCNASGIEPVSIAYQDLKAKRSEWPVRVARGGTLADYVPFYFAPRSPMLYAIAGGWVAGYSGGQVEVAHMVFTANELARADEFVITDGHAATSLSEQFDDFARLDEVDWGIMRDKYWRDTDDDGDRKRRRQAEFLVLRLGAIPRREADRRDDRGRRRGSPRRTRGCVGSTAHRCPPGLVLLEDDVWT